MCAWPSKSAAAKIPGALRVLIVIGGHSLEIGFATEAAILGRSRDRVCYPPKGVFLHHAGAFFPMMTT